MSQDIAIGIKKHPEIEIMIQTIQAIFTSISTLTTLNLFFAHLYFRLSTFIHFQFTGSTDLHNHNHKESVTQGELSLCFIFFGVFNNL